jgi:hypothetical protein
MYLDKAPVCGMPVKEPCLPPPQSGHKEHFFGKRKLALTQIALIRFRGIPESRRTTVLRSGAPPRQLHDFGIMIWPVPTAEEPKNRVLKFQSIGSAVKAILVIR